MYMPDLSGMIEGDLVELKPDESRHLRALRLRAGDVVSITDGKGALWQGKLEDRGRGMGIQLGTRATAPGALPVELWAPVGNKQAMLWVIEKATELGVARIQPVECERSGSVADAGRSQAFWEKARRRAVSALKQSGGGWLPELMPPASFPDLLDRLGSDGGRRVVLDRGGAPLSQLIAGPDVSRVTLLVGPEGGLSPGELAASMEFGFEAAKLGELVLRFETAVTAAMAVIAQKWLVECCDRERSAT